MLLEWTLLLRCCLRMFDGSTGCVGFHLLKGPRFHTSCLMDSQRCMLELVFKLVFKLA